jgi:hypothetical protein
VKQALLCNGKPNIRVRIYLNIVITFYPRRRIFTSIIILPGMRRCEVYFFTA